jgi:hypothetical protein
VQTGEPAIAKTHTRTYTTQRDVTRVEGVLPVCSINASQGCQQLAGGSDMGTV